MAKKTPNETKGRQLTVRLTETAYAWIARKANKESRSLAYIVEELIQKDLREEDATPKTGKEKP